MSERRDFLVEIGTEELPPKALKRLSAAFGAGIVEGLRKANLRFSEVALYATPRRLAVWVTQLALTQPDQTVERRGPALTAAFNENGEPTPAVLGFARSCGVGIEALEQLQNDKGAWLVFRSAQQGRPAQELLPDIVRGALDALPIPRRMRWGSLSEQFVRPVHWVVMLLGDAVIDTHILGVRAGRETRGHRFHQPGRLYIGEPAGYAPLLETEGRVMSDFAQRREAVRAQVLEAAALLKGHAVIDEDLLDEVTSMVEWPQAVVGNFEPRFLEVPAEALISTMKNNQKYFHVVDEAGRLLPHFITISNIQSRDPSAVRAGNERVVRPRLSDAAFFWNQDRKQPLAARLDSLRQVVFQNELGTLHDKIQRVRMLAGACAKAIGGDATLAARAAELSKCDLMSAMVGEFPELQGIMGRYYAVHDGEPREVSVALDEQYMPRHAGDALPASHTGQVLAIADKLDTLVGIFGIGQAPSGDKDPFALRRAALGVLRILIERRLNLDLHATLDLARQQYGRFASHKLTEQVFDFMMERLRAYYHEQHITPDVFEAVLARRPVRPSDFDRCVRAVMAFRALPEAESLAAANKRIANILRQAGITPPPLDDALLREEAERALAQLLASLRDEVRGLCERGEYEQALRHLAGLRGAVDQFFDKVLVMTDDEALRLNRLALLHQLQMLFLGIADISCLQTA